MSDWKKRNEDWRDEDELEEEEEQRRSRRETYYGVKPLTASTF